MLINALVWIVNQGIKSLGGIISMIFSLLPDSPFKTLTMPLSVSEKLGYLNWIIPVAEIISILTLWLLAVGIFYIYQILLRWTKVIE